MVRVWELKIGGVLAFFIKLGNFRWVKKSFFCLCGCIVQLAGVFLSECACSYRLFSSPAFLVLRKNLFPSRFSTEELHPLTLSALSLYPLFQRIFLGLSLPLLHNFFVSFKRFLVKIFLFNPLRASKSPQLCLSSVNLLVHINLEFVFLFSLFQRTRFQFRKHLKSLILTSYFRQFSLTDLIRWLGEENSSYL